MTGITVVEVFKALGVTPEKKLTWAVGKLVQAAYVEKFGDEPPKMNRPKTSGSGSHCFAVYPTRWRKKIEEIILKVCQSNGVVV